MYMEELILLNGYSTVKWSISCQISKQGYQSHQGFQPSKCWGRQENGINTDSWLTPKTIIFSLSLVDQLWFQRKLPCYHF